MISLIDISVIIPMYNSEKYIEETVMSVINQTYKNFEIIVVDDGSTDNSRLKVEMIFKIHSEIKSKILFQENKGLPSARNKGIINAEGNYICFVDSDDILDTNHLSSLYNLIKKNNLNVAHCNYEETTRDNRKGSPVEKKEGIILNRNKVIDYAVQRKPAIIVCGLLVNKDFLIKENLFFNEALRFGEDSDYIWRTLFSCKKIGYTQMNTYKYLMHSNSIMKTITLSLAKIYLFEFQKTIKQIIANNKKDYKLLNTIYYREVIGFLHAFSLCANKEEFMYISNHINRKKLQNSLKSFPDIRIKVLSYIFKFNPMLFYHIFHK